MEIFVNHNGKISLQHQACLAIDNRSFRYADGCFETMLLYNGQIVNVDLHMERLFASLDFLQYKLPSFFNAAFLKDAIAMLALKNQVEQGRIRITIYGGDGSLYHAGEDIGYVIEVNPLDKQPRFNSEGLNLAFYRDAIKAADGFSHIKSNNFLAYALAARWAKKQHLDDAILLNQNGRLADSTIANIFIITDGVIKTPALHEGCINGTMRRYLLTQLRKENMPVYETEINPEDILQASEVFLTNALKGIQWVKKVEHSEYANTLTSNLYQKFIAPMLMV